MTAQPHEDPRVAAARELLDEAERTRTDPQYDHVQLLGPLRVSLGELLAVIDEQSANRDAIDEHYLTRNERWVGP